MKAMERFDLNREQLRTPNDSWVKFSLSKTSPCFLETSTAGKSQWGHRAKSNFEKSTTTGFIDDVSWNEQTPLSQFKDIHSLLSHLKLEHYISKIIFQFSFRPYH